MGIFDALRKNQEKKQQGIPKLVIGINQVDNLGEWDNDINQPTPETEEKIKAKVKDLIEKLTSGNHGASKEQIEYFSALRAYRLPQVINKIIHCTGVITTFKPKEITDPSCSEGMSEENRAEINEMLAKSRESHKKLGMDDFLASIMEKLDDRQRRELTLAVKEKKEKPINVAIIGQSGVGKSTTVNNLFGAKERVSRIGEGTVVNNFSGYKEYTLEDGSVMKVADLPGYGRGVKEDEKYKALYINTLKDCDVILLIMQANDKAIADDQIMVERLYEWSKEGLLTNDGTYYGQPTDLPEDFTVEDDNSSEIVEKTSIKDSLQKAHPEVTPSCYLSKIKELCIEALKTLDKDSDEYNKVLEILNIL